MATKGHNFCKVWIGLLNFAFLYFNQTIRDISLQRKEIAQNNSCFFKNAHACDTCVTSFVAYRNKILEKGENSLDEKIYMHFYILISTYVISISNELNNGLVQFSFDPWCSNSHELLHSILLALIYLFELNPSFSQYELDLILITNPSNRMCLLLFYIPLAVLSNKPQNYGSAANFKHLQ